MTKRTVITGTLLALGTTLLCGGCMKKMSVTETDASVGLNGSFEYEKNGLPVNWQLYTRETTPEGDFDITLDGHDAREGKRSLQFTVRQCSDVGGWRSPGFAREIEATPGDVFHISLWVKGTGSKFRLKVSAVNVLHSVEGPATEPTEVIPDWRQLGYDFTIPEGMNKLRTEGNVLSPGSMWIDDIRITKK